MVKLARSPAELAGATFEFGASFRAHPVAIPARSS
jgi:hypothetical protein